MFRRASRIRLSILDRVSANSGVSDFDTTSSVIGGTFESNISLVDPTIQFSRTEKRLVEQGVSFTADPVKNPSLCPSRRLHLLLLLPIIEGGGYGFDNNVQDVLFRKVVLGALLVGLWAIVREMSDLLAVVALPSFGSCLLYYVGQHP